MNNSFLAMFQKFIDFEKTPKEWNKAIIIPIYNKGDRKDLNNYRRISLTSCVVKFFNRAMRFKLVHFLLHASRFNKLRQFVQMLSYFKNYSPYSHKTIYFLKGN